MLADLSRVMELLPEHVRGNQRESGFRDTETPLAVLIVVHAYDHAILDRCAGINDATM